MQVNIIEQLKDDTKYYGDLGKKYLSASDVSRFLYEPQNLNKKRKVQKF